MGFATLRGLQALRGLQTFRPRHGLTPRAFSSCCPCAVCVDSPRWFSGVVAEARAARDAATRLAKASGEKASQGFVGATILRVNGVANLHISFPSLRVQPTSPSAENERSKAARTCADDSPPHTRRAPSSSSKSSSCSEKSRTPSSSSPWLLVEKMRRSLHRVALRRPTRRRRSPQPPSRRRSPTELKRGGAWNAPRRKGDPYQLASSLGRLDTTPPRPDDVDHIAALFDAAVEPDAPPPRDDALAATVVQRSYSDSVRCPRRPGADADDDDGWGQFLDLEGDEAPPSFMLLPASSAPIPVPTTGPYYIYE